MLRRKPTAIQLTSEDVAAYEDRQIREAQAQAQADAIARVQQNANQNKDPNDELRPLPTDKQRAKSREERLGLVGRS